jgi:hypothetical protein
MKLNPKHNWHYLETFSRRTHGSERLPDRIDRMVKAVLRLSSVPVKGFDDEDLPGERHLRSLH